MAGTIAGGGDAQSHLSLQATAAVSILPENDPPMVADKPGDSDPTIPGTIAEGGALQGKNEVLDLGGLLDVGGDRLEGPGAHDEHVGEAHPGVGQQDGDLGHDRMTTDRKSVV